MKWRSSVGDSYRNTKVSPNGRISEELLKEDVGLNKPSVGSFGDSSSSSSSSSWFIVMVTGASKMLKNETSCLKFS